MAEEQRKKVTYQGVGYLIEDPKGCYVDVWLGTLRGRVAVDPSRPNEPYAVVVDEGGITDDGVRPENATAFKSSAKLALEATYDALKRQNDSIEAREKFDRDAACKEMHDFVAKIDDA
ncbi:MAG: hypothetical protein OXS30_03865 [Chloroflexota bacterium]|nr:hypothetical protein [Chloroflexota bacterium]